MIHISFFSSFSFHFLPLFLFRMPQTGSSPVCGLLFCTYAKKPANRSRQFAGQTVKKVRNRQNQSTNKKCFYGIRRLDFAFRFFDQTYRFCHCEEGAAFAPDAAIFNDAICHSVTKYGRAERRSRSYVFCYKYSFLLRAPVLRHGMPYLWLKDCHGRAAASQ